MSRRFRFGLLSSAVFVFVTILYLSLGGSSDPGASGISTGGRSSSPGLSDKAAFGGAFSGTAGSAGLPESVLTGGAIAPKLGNETAKRELGRASWRLMHTMMARFPEKPTADDSLALQTYIQLFARLYPCGECAAHFQKMLEEYPPQTSSRNAAAGWACFVHNEVNKRLGKEIFDCNKIGDFYDCGCGDEGDEKGGKGGKTASNKPSSDGGGHDNADGDATPAPAPAVLGGGGEGAIKLEKEEGLSRGG